MDLPAGAFYLGSAPTSDVRLPVMGVSRQHALLTVTPTAFSVEDLGSTNGTWLDGGRVRHRAVQIGAELRFGPVRLRLEAAQPEEIELGIALDPEDPEATPISILDREESTVVVRPDLELLRSEEARSLELRFPEGYYQGTSPAILKLFGQMRPLLRGSLPVLLTGETGVGKELIARILHNSSERRNGPFVAVNCAAIPRDLLEAEMFGVGRGVATGVEPRIGKFEEAEGGTLLLDEIGEMDPGLQAKLLRVLQEREIQPLGKAVRKIDVRIVAATHVDLPDRVSEGRLRPDLFYRLAASLLEVPPLRRRVQDLPGLMEHFLRRFRDEAGIRVRGLSLAALSALTGYPWPGNIRELEHELRRLVYAAQDGEVIRSDRLAERFRRPGAGTDGTADRWLSGLDSLELAPALRSVEETLIREALRRASGKKVEACRLLGLSRNGLDKKLKRLDIDVEALKRQGQHG
ncbi:MAG: sigma 54-interacting transcriptional regulator [Acidobacteriota bacterium]